MPRITTVSFQLISGPVSSSGVQSYPLTIGCHDEIEQKTEHFPQGEYTFYAPYIGPAQRTLGNSKPFPDALRPKLLRAIELCVELSDATLLVSERKQNETELKESLKEYPIAKLIIRQYYFNVSLLKHSREKYLPIFTFLVRSGAIWKDWFQLDNPDFQKVYKPMFTDLGKDVFGVEPLNNLLAATPFGDLPNSASSSSSSIFCGFSHYAQAVDFYLTLGANLNGNRFDCPDHGTFLHQCLAYEAVFSTQLIDFLLSKRVLKNPNTYFNFAAQDGGGKTPLMIAIATRNLEVISRLSTLFSKEKIDIGLNIKDKKGRTPLMLATAFGLADVVKTLLENHANPDITDPAGKTFSDYLQFPDLELKEILSLMVHPERGINTGHSYLCANDSGKTPYCLYDDGEKTVQAEEQVKHFIVLSPLPIHQAQIQKVVDILNTQVKQLKSKGGTDFELAKASLEYVKNQIRMIGSETFFNASKKGQTSVKAYLVSAAGIQALQQAKLKCVTAVNSNKNSSLLA